MFRFPRRTPEERIGDIWARGRAAPGRASGRRADRKLAYATELYSEPPGGNPVAQRSALLKKSLYFSGFQHIRYLDLCYYYESDAPGFAYSLTYKTTVSAPESQADFGRCVFHASNFAGNSRWCGEGNGFKRQDLHFILNRLNDKSITERVARLDMTRAELFYNPDLGLWSVLCETSIGVMARQLAAPALSLLAPHPAECVRMVEFMDLIAAIAATGFAVE
jgi:hypothetical protein